MEVEGHRVGAITMLNTGRCDAQTLKRSKDTVRRFGKALQRKS